MRPSVPGVPERQGSRTAKRRRPPTGWSTPSVLTRISGGVMVELVALALLRNPAQQSPNLSLAIAAVSTERAYRRELARLRPARDRFGVDAEHRRHLGRGQERLSLGCASACQGKFLLADRRM